MCKAKKWSVMVGAVLILFAGFQPILAGPKPTDEHPWNGYTGGGTTTVVPQRVYTYYQIQFLSTGGFYLVRVGFSATKAPAIGDSKTVKPKQ
jgi:hypothetical protein